MTNIEKQIVQKTINILINAGCTISVNDGEGYTIKHSNDPSAIFNAMHSSDEDYFDVLRQDKYIGFVYFIYGNDEDVLSDYSWCLDELLTEVNDFAASL